MRATDAYQDLRALGRPFVTTGEAAARLGASYEMSRKTLSRLSSAGLAIHVRHGLWAVDGEPNPYVLPPYLTAPFPAYISLWTALYKYDMIDQVPRDITVVSLSRPKKIKTALGTYDIHQLPPNLFGGFEERDRANWASREKALLDLFYLYAYRGTDALRFPEIELPGDFDSHEFANWIEKISSPRLRSMVSHASKTLHEQLTRVGAQV
jgi:predicted transcriptional regulator of viral defense system